MMGTKHRKKKKKMKRESERKKKGKKKREKEKGSMLYSRKVRAPSGSCEASGRAEAARTKPDPEEQLKRAPWRCTMEPIGKSASGSGLALR